MEKKVKLLSLILFCCLMVATENATAQRFAIQGGLENSSIVSKEKPNNILNKTGFDIGFFIETPLNYRQTLNINFAVDVVLKGWKEKYDDQLYILYNQLYEEFSLSLSYRFHIVNDVFSILPYAGMYGGVLMNFSDSNNSQYEDFYEYMNMFDYGIRVGGAIEIVRNVQFGAEKNIGLPSIYKGDNLKVTNNGTRLYIRLFF